MLYYILPDPNPELKIQKGQEDPHEYEIVVRNHRRGRNVSRLDPAGRSGYEYGTTFPRHYLLLVVRSRMRFDRLADGAGLLPADDPRAERQFEDG